MSNPGSQSLRKEFRPASSKEPFQLPSQTSARARALPRARIATRARIEPRSHRRAVSRAALRAAWPHGARCSQALAFRVAGFGSRRRTCVQLLVGASTTMPPEPEHERRAAALACSRSATRESTARGRRGQPLKRLRRCRFRIAVAGLAFPRLLFCVASGSRHCTPSFFSAVIPRCPRTSHDLFSMYNAEDATTKTTENPRRYLSEPSFRTAALGAKQ